MMMSVDFIFYINMLFLSFLIFSSGFFYFLKVLLSLEFVVISALMVITFFSSLTYFTYLGLYFLIFSSCEMILGLSLMILMVRKKGADHVSVVSVGKW